MKKVLAMLALVAVVGMLAGCGSKENMAGKNDNKVENTQDDKSGGAATPDNNETDAEGTNEDSGDSLEPGVYLPVTEEKVNFSVWTIYGNSYLSDPNETKAVQELEARTNVHIDWVPVSPLEASEKYGLMLASGNVPDIVRGANIYYPGGMAKAIGDGIYLDVTEEIPKYMPNYMALIKSNTEAQKGYISDDGRLYGVWYLKSDDYNVASQKPYLGLMIRQDWLDELGFAMPETIDEWHTILTAFKNEKGAKAPLMIGNDGTIYGSAFTSAFGVLTEFYVEDNVVKYGPAEQGYKEFLDTFRQWYAEGLIDPDFTANNAGILFCNGE